MLARGKRSTESQGGGEERRGMRGGGKKGHSGWKGRFGEKIQAELFIFPTVAVRFMTVRAASACEKRLLAPLRRQYQCSSVGGNTKLNEKARESSTLSLLPSPCSMRDMNASHRAVGKDSMFFSVHILADSLDFCLFSCHALEKRGHRKCSRGGRGHFVSLQNCRLFCGIGLGAKCVLPSLPRAW